MIVHHRLFRLFECGLIATVLAAVILVPGRVSERASAGDDSRRAEEFLMVPVRVHLIRSDDTALGTKLTNQDVIRIFRKANGIWHAAGIHLWVESILAEKPAAMPEREKDSSLPLGVVSSVRPIDSRPEGMFHVYYVGAMTVNGWYRARDAVFVQEAAKLIAVPGGIDEPLPRVTSHELGHGLGLPHRQARTNLMASGTTGTSLNEEEIHTARRSAQRFPWIETAESFIKKADELAKAGKRDAAELRYNAILDLPGPSPLKDRAKNRTNGSE